MCLGTYGECELGEVSRILGRGLESWRLDDEFPFDLEGGDLAIDVDLPLVVLV